MKLFYCDVPNGNFGDDLNTWLWPQLMPGAFEDMVRFWPKEPKVVDVSNPQDTLFVGIGTLIIKEVPTLQRKLVFGSGTSGLELPVLDDRWEFHCVRGPLTASALGLPPEMAIADAAILVRLLPPVETSRIYRASFIPHYCQAQSGAWQKICAATGVQFIDPRWSPAKVIKAISQSQMVIAEALHGAIVADALRVPWVAVSSKHHIQDFKWRDWCASIGETYDPISIPPIWKPQAGVKSAIINPLKMAHGAFMLSGLGRRARLSSERRIENLTDRLVEALKGFARKQDVALNLSPRLAPEQPPQEAVEDREERVVVHS